MNTTNVTALADQKSIAHTDGSCIGNPGPGGWAWTLQAPTGEIISNTGGEPNSTNIRMEMIAVCEVLEASQDVPRLEICTDCMMIIQGFNGWLEGWKQNNWRKSNKKPVLNKDLWQRMDALLQGREVIFTHVKAHSGIAGNEAVDTLALKAARRTSEEYRRALVEGTIGEDPSADTNWWEN